MHADYAPARPDPCGRQILKAGFEERPIIGLLDVGSRLDNNVVNLSRY
jgi:hypothetical protein